MKRYVVCNLRSELYHKYQDAPDEVSYLRNLHRHELHITVKMEVFHNDREVEFIMLKHQVEAFIETLGYNLPTNSNVCVSCESIAEEIIGILSYNYSGDREIEVTVMEDGENGAIVNNRR